jgi:adenine-specific DNA-methyltransferase
MSESKIQRLNYIGSKFQLLDWIDKSILNQTGWKDYVDRSVADLFSGTGVVLHNYRKQGAVTFGNDAELYSSIISYALSISIFTETVSNTLSNLNQELTSEKHKSTIGFVTKHYSPYQKCERMFFTVDNAQRIDYLRQRIEEYKSQITENEYKFLVASLLLAADAVSNVPAVYGCYLKNFKTKANKELILVPIHTISEQSAPNCQMYNSDVLSSEFIKTLNEKNLELIYLDPPYNERQYSKNYFPLNIIAMTPAEQEIQTLKGKTGIPEGCFTSAFCKKREIQSAFEQVFSLNAKWIVLSYSSEGLLSKDSIVEMMKKYGTVNVVEREYKRFKSFEYNEKGNTMEYLFILGKELISIR